MRRLLIIAADYPFPPRYGFTVRVADLCRGLAGDCEQHLLAYRAPPSSETELDGSDVLASVRFVDPAVVTPARPWPARLAQRMAHRLRAPFFDQPLYTPPALLDAVRCYHREVGFDACLVHTPLLARCFQALPSSVVRILDAHDLWYEKHAQFAQLGEGRLLAHFRDRVRELAAYRAADLTLAISLHDEAELVRQGVPAAQVLHVPVSFRPRPVTSRVAEPVLLYAGGHGVFNTDAIVHFVEHILPRVRAEVPAARLAVLGAQSPLRIRYGTHTHVDLLPPVTDVADAYQRAQLVVVPLRYGTGLKIKVLEAFAHRMPAVLSEAAIQGLHLDDYPQASFSVEPASFAREVLRVLRDPTARAALAEAGHATLLRHYQPDAVYGGLRNWLHDRDASTITASTSQGSERSRVRSGAVS